MKTKTNPTGVIRIKAETTYQDAKEYADKYREQTRARVLNELRNAGVTELPLCNLSFGVYLCGFKNPYDEIKNIVAQLANAMADGYDFYLEAIRLRQEVQRLKGIPVEEAKYVDCTAMLTLKESEVHHA